MTAGKPRWICLKWKLVLKKAGKDTHILRLQFNTTAHCVFVSLSPRGIYFDTIRESLHTPRRKRFSRSGPPMAAVTGPWLWVTWKGLQGAGARTPTDTRSEKCLANDENCPTCPLVKVPSSWLNCVRPWSHLALAGDKQALFLSDRALKTVVVRYIVHWCHWDITNQFIEELVWMWE